MNIQQIKYFLTLAKYRNFTKASKYLYISQSALSRQILDLEEYLGVSLFDRNSRSVQLTAAGEVFQREGGKLLDRLERVIEMTRGAGEGKSGCLRIGSLDSINYRVTQLIKEFHAEYKDVFVSIERYNTTTLTEAVVCGDLDLGFTFLFAVTDYEELAWKTLFKEEFCVLISKDSPLARKPDVKISDIQKEPIILPHFVHPPFIERLLINDRSTSISYTSTMENLLIQVESGLGISFVPRFYSAGMETNHNVCMCNISETDQTADIVLVWNKSNTNSVLKEFREMAGKFFP